MPASLRPNPTVAFARPSARRPTVARSGAKWLLSLCLGCGGSAVSTPGAGGFESDVEDICEDNFRAPCNPMTTWESCVTSLESPRREAQAAGCGDLYDAVVDCWARNGAACNGALLVRVRCDGPRAEWRGCVGN